MIVEILEDKHPAETVLYTLSLSRNSNLSSDIDVLTTPTFTIYDVTDLATNIPSMLGAAGFDSTKDRITCEVTGGTSGEKYRLVGKATCTSGREYIGMGNLKVKNLGITL